MTGPHRCIWALLIALTIPAPSIAQTKAEAAEAKRKAAQAYLNIATSLFRNKDYEGALADYVKALGIDHESVAGPGLGTVILNYKYKSSSVKERALYLNEQLQLPEAERVLSIKELDEGQVMHKPGKL